MSSLKFIEYNGPPKPKGSSYRTLSKNPPSAEHGDEKGLPLPVDEVKAIDLAYIDDDDMTYLFCDSKGECVDVGNDHGRSDLMSNAQRDSSYGKLTGLRPSEVHGQGNAVNIDDSRSIFEADLRDSCEEDADLQDYDSLQSWNFSTTEFHERGSDIETNSVAISATIDRMENQAIKLQQTQIPVRLPIVDNASRNSIRGSDIDDGEPIGKRTNRKRQDRGLSSKDTRRRQKTSSQFQKKAAFRRHLNTKSASETQSSDTVMSYDGDNGDDNEESYIRALDLRNRLKPPASTQSISSCFRSGTERSSTTHAPPQAIWTRRRSARRYSSGTTQWNLSDIAFHPLSDGVSFLTALFRAGGPAILSSACAVKILKSILGRALKLDDIIIKPLTSDTWFLTSRSDASGRRMCQSASAPPNSRLDTPSDEGSDEGSDDDSESSGGNYGKNDHGNDDYSIDTFDVPANSRKRRRWSEKDDKRLRDWKAQGKSWGWICSRFSGRSPAAVQVRWHTKLREKA